MDADVDIMVTHDYGANASLASPSQASLQYNKPMWQTEVYKGKTYNGSISDALSWADSIHGALSTGNFSAWFYWWSMDPYNDNQALIAYNNSSGPTRFQSVCTRSKALADSCGQAPRSLQRPRVIQISKRPRSVQPAEKLRSC